MEEIWKEVVSCGVRLLVSNLGGVRRIAHTTEYEYSFNGIVVLGKQTFPERRLSPYVAENGYVLVALKINGVRKKHPVHRLVAMAFVSGYAPKLFVNHINGIKTDNRPENLEWVTPGRNTEHAWETSLVDLRGEKHPSAKLRTADIARIAAMRAEKISVPQIAKIFGVSKSTIYKILSGERWPVR